MRENGSLEVLDFPKGVSRELYRKIFDKDTPCFRFCNFWLFRLSRIFLSLSSFKKILTLEGFFEYLQVVFLLPEPQSKVGVCEQSSIWILQPTWESKERLFNLSRNL